MNFLKDLFYKDEKVCRDILNRINIDSVKDVQDAFSPDSPYDTHPTLSTCGFRFNLDGFDMRVMYTGSYGRGHGTNGENHFEVDHISMDCSKRLMGKIFTKLYDIANYDYFEKDRMTRKDIKIAFSRDRNQLLL